MVTLTVCTLEVSFLADYAVSFRVVSCANATFLFARAGDRRMTPSLAGETSFSRNNVFTYGE